MSMRELPPPDELLKPRDHEPIVIVPPNTWHCLFCEPHGRPGAGTTVDWVGPGTEAPDGRCRECGQKFCLAASTSIRLREGMPARAVAAGEGECEYCAAADNGPRQRPTVTWRGERADCVKCGQRYTARAA